MHHFARSPRPLRVSLILAGLLVAAPLFAKIGEKKEDLVDRWGRPLPGLDSVQATMWVLRDIGYLAVWSDKNVSITESIRKLNPEEPLSDTQIADFLKLQLPPEAKWERIPLGEKTPAPTFGSVTVEADPAREELWRTSDGKRLARIVRGAESSITVYSEDGLLEEWLRKKMSERPAPAKP